MTSRQDRIDKGLSTERSAAEFSISASLQRMIQLPLFTALEESGGRGRPRDLYERIADTAGVGLEARAATRECADGQSYKVFQQQVRWARQTAVAEGLIAGDRGVWELTDAAYAKLGRIRRGAVVLIYSTDEGIALWAHAEDAASHIEQGSVKLVLTSPPYPVIKRAYGRLSVPEWLHWMKRLVAIWKELIADDGTIAVNLMDVFVSGTPAISPYVERFTLSAIDDVGLHLAGRMPWHSPTKLGNIEWTAKRKVQPKNSLEHVLLFSKSPNPAWDITRMDRPARAARSDRQREADAARLSTVRPSGHSINERAFMKAGAQPLPGNLIVAGGSGGGSYATRCRAASLQPHPARFPEALPRQIILLATDVGQIVYDPMAGSNMTGKVAGELGRRWISSEPMLEYVRGSELRFT
ncbi:site-specific DNA-methyltransferase [Mesorhizobium sp. M0189]|uniref:site-specific DNA-methyltransferase n=1 Tax=Mesorhizobium sp. M0189 TaxID=2956909 RepID=UPI0033371B10